MRLYIGLIALVVLAIAAVLIMRLDGEEAPNGSETPAPAVAQAPEKVKEDGKEAQAVYRIPAFDIVRVDPSGEAVVAGRAGPNALVTLYANGKEIGSVKADDFGDWALVVTAPLDQSTQDMTLTAHYPDGEEVTSEQHVVIAVPQRPQDKPLVVLNDPENPSRVLQPAEARPGPLSIDSIDYGAGGAVGLSGTAPEGHIVRVYLDDALIGEAASTEKNTWALAPAAQIEAGLYRLRADLLDETGKVIARVETPFERAVPSELVLSAGKVVVQPGNNLWRIARHVYGSGLEYTVIFRANRDQIRDPDLIYPGQVFEMPAKP